MSETVTAAAPGLGWPVTPVDPVPHPAPGLGWPAEPIDPQSIHPQSIHPPAEEHA